MGRKGRRENEGHWEAEAGREKMDSRAQRETKDYQDRGVSQEKQGCLEEMALWGVLEILDPGETLGPLDHLVTQEDRDSTILDREEPLETEVILVKKDQEGAEVNVVPKENLELMDHQESLGSQVRQVDQGKEDPEVILELMGVQDLWAILGSMTVMS